MDIHEQTPERKRILEELAISKTVAKPSLSDYNLIEATRQGYIAGALEIYGQFVDDSGQPYATIYKQ